MQTVKDITSESCLSMMRIFFNFFSDGFIILSLTLYNASFNIIYMMLYMNVINIVVPISRYEYIVIYKKVEE